TVEQAQEQIKDSDTLLLEFALGEDRSYAWIVGPKKFRSYELPGSGQIYALVARMHETLAKPQKRTDETLDDFQGRARRLEKAFEEASSQLSRVLFGSLDLEVTKRILIVPDGPLQEVPFAALPVPTQNANEAILISRFEVDMLPSASVLDS